MNSIVYVALLMCSVNVGAAPSSNDEDSPDSSFAEISYRPPHFTRPIYKATLINEKKILYMDGPVILENGNDGMYFVITSDNYEDYSIIITDANDTSQKEIQFELTSTNPITKEFDVIVLEALDADLVPVSRTTILIFTPNMEFNIYKMTFKVDNEEYIVLNYFYFKWFLGLLTVTGLLILIIELHEIARNIKIGRAGEKYQELQNI